MQENVLSALKQCYDPEIPVNSVDPGLIAPAPGDQVRSRLQQLLASVAQT